MGAIVLSTVAYLIPLSFGNAWLGFFFVLVIAVAFLGVLNKFMGKNLDSKAIKTSLSIYLMVLISFQTLVSVHDYARKDSQKEILIEIRQVIEEGITKAQVQKPLLYVLSEYQKQTEGTITELAHQILGEKLEENGRFDTDLDREEEEDEDIYFYEEDQANDVLTVIAVSKVVPGANTEFQNFDGQTGMLEIRVSLSKKGVSYALKN
jgi:hypothetical protein